MDTNKTIVRPITRLSHKALANTLVNRFMGFKAIDEEKGPKLGKRWAYINFRKPMKMRVKHRTLKGDNGKALPNPHKNNVG